MSMRRTDRQMDRDSAWQAVNACSFGTVSMLLPEGEPYCVPLSIARIGETLYFHCAQEGLKLKALRKHPAVCVSCVGMAEPVHDKFTTRYTSAILTGTAREVTDEAEKIRALRAICEKYTPENMSRFDAAIAQSLSRTGIWRIDVTDITGKCKK